MLLTDSRALATSIGDVSRRGRVLRQPSVVVGEEAGARAAAVQR
jgi:hypothetical protein